MKSAVRRSQILQDLAEVGSVTVVDLAERFAVSAMTIRRDLLELERQGLARRDEYATPDLAANRGCPSRRDSALGCKPGRRRSCCFRCR